MGSVRIIRVRINEEVDRFITFIWSCTNSLIPKTNGILLSYKSKKAIVVSYGGLELAVPISFLLGK